MSVGRAWRVPWGTVEMINHRVEISHWLPLLLGLSTTLLPDVGIAEAAGGSSKAL